VTSTEIHAALPNGFHDAFLRELRVDFAGQEAWLAFDFHVGDPDADTEGGRETRRSGVLRLRGLASVKVEPPDSHYSFARPDGLWVDGGFGPYPGDASAPDDGFLRLWLFIQTWNARMMFTARECSLEWT
jgi:hypothetical protein